MAKRPTIDPALRELKQELLRTNDALKDAYTRFNCVCDSELIEASIYEISALKSRCNYLLRRIKELSGEAVPSAVPRAQPVQAAAACMSLVEKCALGLVLLFLLAACLRLLRQPLKLALRVLINSALGFCALWLLNMTTGLTGLSLGLNLFNALTIGVLGVPGLGLLLLLKWVLV